MSINTSSVVYNTRERAESPDQNNAQSLVARTNAQIQKYLMSVMPIIGSSEIRNAILGMNPTVSGANFVLGEGVLLTTNATDQGEIPTAFESDYRVGLWAGGTAAAIPAHGGQDRYVLIEARVTQTETNEDRDILSPGGGSSVETSVPKRRDLGVEFQIIDNGATDPTTIPDPTAGWVPVFAAFINASVDSGDLIDLRSTPTDWAGPARELPNLHNTDIIPLSREAEVGRPSNSAFLRVSAIVNGFVCNFRTTGNAPVDIDALLNGAFAPDTWYFLYLAPAARTNATSGGEVYYRAGNGYDFMSCDGNCVAALSTVRPTSTYTNSATVTLGRPFAGRTMVAGRMGCVGAFYRATGAAWEYHRVTPAGDAGFGTFTESDGYILEDVPDGLGGNTATVTIASDGAALLGFSSMVQHLILQPVVTTVDGAATGFLGFSGVADSANNPMDRVWAQADISNRPSTPFTVPVHQDDDEAIVRVDGITSAGAPGTINTAATNGTGRWALRLVGYKI